MKLNTHSASEGDDTLKKSSWASRVLNKGIPSFPELHNYQAKCRIKVEAGGEKK